MRYRTDDPRLQKAQQKIAAIPPEHRAIYDDSMAVAGWARDDMLRQLKLGEIGQSIKRQKGQLGLKRKGLALENRLSKKKYGLGKRQAYQSEKEFKYGKKQDKYANLLAGATFVGGKYLDYKKYKTDKMVADAKLSAAQDLNNKDVFDPEANLREMNKTNKQLEGVVSRLKSGIKKKQGAAAAAFEASRKPILQRGGRRPHSTSSY